MNSELRQPAVNLVKWGDFFAIQTLNKVDLVGRVTLLPGTTFVHTNEASKTPRICINV